MTMLGIVGLPNSKAGASARCSACDFVLGGPDGVRGGVEGAPVTSIDANAASGSSLGIGRPLGRLTARRFGGGGRSLRTDIGSAPIIAAVAVGARVVATARDTGSVKKSRIGGASSSFVGPIAAVRVSGRRRSRALRGRRGNALRRLLLRAGGSALRRDRGALELPAHDHALERARRRLDERLDLTNADVVDAGHAAVAEQQRDDALADDDREDDALGGALASEIGHEDPDRVRRATVSRGRPSSSRVPSPGCCGDRAAPLPARPCPGMRRRRKRRAPRRCRRGR